MLALEALGVGLIGKGEYELLTRGAQPACGPIEQYQRLPLQKTGQAAAAGRRAVGGAGVEDRRRLGRYGPVERGVCQWDPDGEHSGGDEDGKAHAGEQEQRGQKAGGAREQERRAECLADGGDERLIGPTAKLVVGLEVRALEAAALRGNGASQADPRLIRLHSLEERR